MQNYSVLANSGTPKTRFNENVIFCFGASISRKPNFFEIFMKPSVNTFAVSNLRKQKMKTKVILAGLLACIGITAQAQDTKTEEPKGKAIVQVFGNFHTGFGA